MAKFKLKIELVPTDVSTPEAKTQTAKALSRQLRITALTLLLTMGMIIAVTIAWFASNREVDSNEMEVNVQTAPNLVIEKTAADLLSATASDENLSVSFSEITGLHLVPATYDTLGTYSSNTGLIYNTNAGIIDMTTGHKKSGTDPSTGLAYEDEAFDDVPVSNDNTSEFYRDYTVFLASVDQALDVSDASTKKWALNASFDGTLDTPAVGTQMDYQYAASVDFYLIDSTNTTPTTTNFKGTLNLKYKDTATTADDNQTVNLFGGANPVTMTTIPQNTTGSVQVLMRVYFDGALDKDSPVGTAYVRSNTLATDDITLNIHFAAVEVNAS